MSSSNFVQRRHWLISTETVCKWSFSDSTEADRSCPDTNRLAGEYFPAAAPPTKEERRTRLAGLRVNPLPQLPAQNPVEPAPAEETTATVLHPGESHKLYYAHDVLGSVPEAYALVVERAARWCGVGEDLIYAVVERFERRFLWWKKKKDKLEKELVGSGSESDGSGEEEE